MAKKRKSALSKRLQALRERLNLTQAEAAARVFVSVHAWKSWEADQKNPSPRSLALIRMLEEGKI